MLWYLPLMLVVVFRPRLPMYAPIEPRKPERAGPRHAGEKLFAQLSRLRLDQPALFR